MLYYNIWRAASIIQTERPPEHGPSRPYEAVPAYGYVYSRLFTPSLMR